MDWGKIGPDSPRRGRSGLNDDPVEKGLDALFVIIEVVTNLKSVSIAMICCSSYTYRVSPG